MWGMHFGWWLLAALVVGVVASAPVRLNARHKDQCR